MARAGGVPVPPALGLCEDASVNEGPFYVMGLVAGVVLDTGEIVAETFPDPTSRWAIGEDVVDILANLHRIDADQVGLGDLGRKEAYLARQIKRWRRQWDESRTRDLPLMQDVASRLEQTMPEQVGWGIVHGDYRLGNMLTGRSDGRIKAVLDWELCTIGDPLADLGYLMNNWVEPGEDSPTSQRGSTLPTSAGAFPTDSSSSPAMPAAELAADRIRVNAICPGPILTPLMHGGRPEEAIARMQPFVPWPHLGEPEDIANAALFFASDESRWITGDVMVVDGGLIAASPGITRRGGIRTPPPGMVGVDRGTTGEGFLVRQRPDTTS